MKTRIITAIVAIALVIPFILIGGNLYIAGIGAVALLGFREFYNLNKTHDKIPNIVSILSLVFYYLIIYSDVLVSWNIKDILIFGILAILFPSVMYKKDIYTIKDGFNILGSIILLGFAFNSFIKVRFLGLPLFFYLVTIPAITDTFAYFTGMFMGKHKMCPKISPKKTWEGFVGGLIFGTVIPCFIYFSFISSFDIKIVLLTIILSVIGQYGDLLFSKLKRENDIKDFSNILPGHGGVLDRLDSTIAIFLTYLFLTSILF